MSSAPVSVMLLKDAMDAALAEEAKAKIAYDAASEIASAANTRVNELSRYYQDRFDHRTKATTAYIDSLMKELRISQIT